MSVEVRLEQPHVARVLINRPDVHNALDDRTIADLTGEFVRLGREKDIRVIVLTGAGDTFCSGTDITWMEQVAARSHAEDARRLGNLLQQIRQCPKVTIAEIYGRANGAGLALASICDISVADDEAHFSLPAVRLGHVPAMITPFLLQAVSANVLRRYMLTGETFSAEDARRVGFVHAIALGARVPHLIEGLIAQVLDGGPEAQQAIKSLIGELEFQTVSRRALELAAKRSGAAHRSEEACEGLSAFIEKRRPAWLGKRGD